MWLSLFLQAPKERGFKRKSCEVHLNPQMLSRAAACWSFRFRLSKNVAPADSLVEFFCGWLFLLTASRCCRTSTFLEWSFPATHKVHLSPQFCVCGVSWVCVCASTSAILLQGSTMRGKYVSRPSWPSKESEIYFCRCKWRCSRGLPSLFPSHIRAQRHAESFRENVFIKEDKKKEETEKRKKGEG